MLPIIMERNIQTFRSAPRVFPSSFHENRKARDFSRNFRFKYSRTTARVN